MVDSHERGVGPNARATVARAFCPEPLNNCIHCRTLTHAVRQAFVQVRGRSV